MADDKRDIKDLKQKFESNGINSKIIYRKSQKTEKKEKFLYLFHKDSGHIISIIKGGYSEFNKYEDIVKYSKSYELITKKKTLNSKKSNILMKRDAGEFKSHYLGNDDLMSIKKNLGRSRTTNKQIIVEIRAYKGKKSQDATGTSGLFKDSSIYNINEEYTDAVISALSKLPFTPDYYIVLNYDIKIRSYFDMR